MTHDEMRDALGAYVLGALEPTERAEVAAHVEGCDDCRAEVAALAPLPGLLGRLSNEEATATTVPTPNGPVVGALAEIRRRRRARRLRTGLVAAALVVLAATAAVVVHERSTGPAGTVFTASAPATHVDATARLEEHASGTTIALTLTGVPSDARCRLVVIGRDGHREVAGSWRASYAGDVTVEGATAMRQREIASMRVVTFAGRQLVRIPIAGA